MKPEPLMLTGVHRRMVCFVIQFRIRVNGKIRWACSAITEAWTNSNILTSWSGSQMIRDLWTIKPSHN